MNFKGTPYTDYIYESLNSEQGKHFDMASVLYSADEIATVPGCELYCRLMKSACCLSPSSREMTQFSLLSLILLHYKYITVEQFHALMPWASPNLLSLYCKDIRNERKPGTSKSRTKSRRKDIRLNAYSLAGASNYYMLTRGMYEEVLSHVPATYLSDNRISLRAPDSPGVHALHQVLTNNTPLRMLRDSSFAPFCWFTNVVLNPELSIEDNLAVHGSNTSLLANNGSVAAYSKKPDGIISTETVHGTYYCLVEQDMGTERSAKLNDKHRFYGELFKQESDCSNITVLFNSARPQSDTKLKHRPPDYARQSTYSHALSKLRVTMTRNGLFSVAEARFFLLTEESRRNEGLSHGDWLSVKSQLSLISDYLSARPGRPMDDGTISDIESFVNEVTSDAMYSRNENIYIQEQPRADRMREELLEFVLSDKGAELRQAMLSKGLSYIVINRVAFDRYAPAVLLKESSYVNEIFGVLSGTSLVGYRSSLGHIARSSRLNGYYFRNMFDLSDKSVPVTVFEEISCDVGGYLRAYGFSETYTGGGEPMNMVLLVARDSDVEAFMKRSSISHFMTYDADTPSRKYGVHVAFINYTDKSPAPFVLSPDGEQRTYLKNIKEMEEYRICAE